MACYKFMAVHFGKPAKGIEKDHKYLLTERRDIVKIVVIATINRIGIYGTRISVNVSTLL